MNKWVWLIGLALIPGPLLQAQSTPAKVVDRIVAQVNDDIITLSELNRSKVQMRQELAEQYSGEQLEREMKRLESDLLQSLIEKKLMLQKANELGMGSGMDVQVSAHIEKVRKDNNIKDMDEFERALEQSGMTLAGYRDDIKKEMIIQEIKGYFVDSRITLLSEEVERFYKDHTKEFSSAEEVTLSEILIPAGTDDQGQSLAAEYRKRAAQGESFAALASQYSKGPTANKGGSIGTYQVAKLSESIAKTIAGVKEGDISDVVKLPEGYAFLRVDARKLPVVKPLDEVRSEIKNYLYQLKYRPEYERFIAQLKEDAYIQIFSELGIGK